MTVSAITTPPATSTASATPATTSASNPLGSLSNNFNDFLKLLMTQLQNQDPSSPMDATTFTTQLVQFSSVEQQINTNGNLHTLIQATQSNTVLQSSALVGKHVTATSSQLPLQNSTASAQFTAPSAETVNILVQAPNGSKVLQTTMSAQPGSNSWTWNGQNDQGTTVADGSYKITITDPSETALPTTVSGTVTGVGRSTIGVSVSLGSVTADVSTIQSVANN